MCSFAASLFADAHVNDDSVLEKVSPAVREDALNSYRSANLRYGMRRLMAYLIIMSFGSVAATVMLASHWTESECQDKTCEQIRGNLLLQVLTCWAQVSVGVAVVAVHKCIGTRMRNSRMLEILENALAVPMLMTFLCGVLTDENVRRALIAAPLKYTTSHWGSVIPDFPNLSVMMLCASFHQIFVAPFGLIVVITVALSPAYGLLTMVAAAHRPEGVDWGSVEMQEFMWVAVGIPFFLPVSPFSIIVPETTKGSCTFCFGASIERLLMNVSHGAMWSSSWSVTWRRKLQLPWRAMQTHTEHPQQRLP